MSVDKDEHLFMDMHLNFLLYGQKSKHICSPYTTTDSMGLNFIEIGLGCLNALYFYLRLSAMQF